MGNRNIAKICPIAKQRADPDSLGSKLKKEGYDRLPGTVSVFVPYKEKNGKYRTGLDLNASYIKEMSDQEAEVERGRIKGWLEQIGDYIDVNPNSDFYRRIYDDKMFSSERARVISLSESEMIFNLQDLDELINFAWLRVHPQIAPSLTAYRNSSMGSRVQYYVHEADVEDKMQYEENVYRNRAIAVLESMDSVKRKKVARLLALGADDSSTDKAVYNVLNKWLDLTEAPAGPFQGQQTIKVFMDFATMKEENLEIRDKVKQAFEYNLYRKVNGVIYDGEVPLEVSDEEGLINLLLSKKAANQQMLLSLEKRLTVAKNNE